jgi:hypothetical protein
LIVKRAANLEKIIKFLKLSTKITPKMGNFAISFIIYKAIMPMRLALSALVIPIVIKYLPDENANPETTTLL